MNIIWTGKVEHGKLRLDLEERFEDFLKSLDGRKVKLVLSKYKEPRSLKQNAYYWSVCVPLIADYIGEESLEDTHETLKSMFNVDRTKKIPIVKSTTKLNTEEFNNYIERIKIWASQEGVIIPDPNQIEEID